MKVTVTEKDADGGFYVEVDGVYSPGWFPTRAEAEAYAEDIRQGRRDGYTPAEWQRRDTLLTEALGIGPGEILRIEVPEEAGGS